MPNLTAKLSLFPDQVSLLLKGRTLERHLGSFRFLLLLVYLMGLTGVVYVAAAMAASRLTGQPSLERQCVVGFSGVLFALKVLTNHLSSSPGETETYFGYDVPRRMAVW